MNPVVSILIPSIAGYEILKQCLESVNQSVFRDFETLVLCTLSESEKSTLSEIFNGCQLTFLEPRGEHSIATARNRLLREAKGQFIAWMDDDDTMVPERLEIQLKYFNDHPETDVLGSWMIKQGDKIDLRNPLVHQDIATHLWYRNCIFQPTVMSRHFYVKENLFYDESYAQSVEDYELWYRLSKTKTFANLDSALVSYNYDLETQKAKRLNNGFDNNIRRLWDKKWKDKNITASYSVKELFVRFIYNNFQLEHEESEQLKDLLHQIIADPGSNEYDGFMCGFFEFRLWLNSSFRWRIQNLKVLFNAMKYAAYREKGLIYR